VARVRAQIFAIYKEHNPSKMLIVDSLLKEWEGEEEILLSNIQGKYRSEVDEHAPWDVGFGAKLFGVDVGEHAGAMEKLECEHYTAQYESKAAPEDTAPHEPSEAPSQACMLRREGHAAYQRYGLGQLAYDHTVHPCDVA
jgi:hypothetical protein